jgi:REP element-mobilizing transposase RayT
MKDKFQNKYRIPSARLQNWDYSSNGGYFITICTQNRVHYFGEIKDAAMQLSTIGQLAEHYWKEIPNHFPFVKLGNFVVMPNHVHGILIINKCHDNNDIASENNDIAPENDDNTAQTRLIASVRGDEINIGGFAGDKNPMFHDSISKIIRWYKGRCSFEIRKSHASFEWQSRFHDHIIRNAHSYENIQNYIRDNPKKWKEDKFF